MPLLFVVGALEGIHLCTPKVKQQNSTTSKPETKVELLNPYIYVQLNKAKGRKKSREHALTIIYNYPPFHAFVNPTANSKTIIFVIEIFIQINVQYKVDSNNLIHNELHNN